jgi:hypothetical protein
MSWTLIAAVAILLLYVFWGRAWARNRWAWFDAVLDKIEPYEQMLWKKSRTIFLARLYQLAGFLVTAQGFLVESGVDWVSIIPIPEKYQLYVGPVVWVTGLAFAQLRKATDKPLEIVNTPDLPEPEVAAAVAKVEDANATAVAAVAVAASEAKG